MVEFTLFDLLNPGPTGRFGFSMEHTEHLLEDKDEKPGKEVTLADQILEFMADYGLFTHHFETTPSAIDELGIEEKVLDGTPYLTFNMARMARLPGVNPHAELRELYDLFASFKPLFANFPGAFPSISITNDHDEAGLTYGTLSVGMRDATDEEEAAAKAASAEAMNRIAASPALSSWLQKLALDLDSIGPYSGYRLNDEHFFDYEENPVMQHLRNNPTPRKPKTPAQTPKYKADEFGRRIFNKNTGKKHDFFL